MMKKPKLEAAMPVLPDRVEMRGATAFADTAKAVSVMNRESRVRASLLRFR
jgi:hypothetical protein